MKNQLIPAPVVSFRGVIGYATLKQATKFEKSFEVASWSGTIECQPQSAVIMYDGGKFIYRFLGINTSNYTPSTYYGTQIGSGNGMSYPMTEDSHSVWGRDAVQFLTAAVEVSLEVAEAFIPFIEWLLDKSQAHLNETLEKKEPYYLRSVVVQAESLAKTANCLDILRMVVYKAEYRKKNPQYFVK